MAESRAGAARWEASARTWEGRTGTPDSSDVSTPDVAGMGTPRHADTGTAEPGGLPRRERRPAFQDAPAREQSASVWDSTDTLPSITPVDAATAYAAAPTPAEPPGAPEPYGGTEASGPLSSGDHSGRFRLSLPTDSTASFPLRKRTGEGGDG